MKDNYLCIKESAACRRLGSWSFLSSSPPPYHLHLFSFFFLFLFFLFFFFFAQAVFHSSLHVDWVIRSDCETSQRRDAWQRQLGRTEQRALSTCITPNKSFVYKELRWKGADRLHWLDCQTNWASSLVVMPECDRFVLQEMYSDFFFATCQTIIIIKKQKKNYNNTLLPDLKLLFKGSFLRDKQSCSRGSWGKWTGAGKKTVKPESFRSFRRPFRSLRVKFDTRSLQFFLS